jgi:hypothetical protein
MATKQTIERFGQGECRTVNAAALAALTKVAAEFGLTVEQERGMIGADRTTFTSKFTFAAGGKTAGQVEYDRHRTIYGLPEFGFQFRGSRGLFTVCGFNPKSRTRPVHARCADDGKTYLFEVDQIKAQAALAAVRAKSA